MRIKKLSDFFIDENGICYIFGAGNPAGWPQVPTGAIFLDVAANPTSPTHLGQWNEQYIHDGMARGDTMYVGCIYDGSVHIVDVSDKANPSTLGSAYTPDLFTHNAWVSDDGNYVFTTDEKPDGYLGAFDISDLNNIEELFVNASYKNSSIYYYVDSDNSDNTYMEFTHHLAFLSDVPGDFYVKYGDFNNGDDWAALKYSNMVAPNVQLSLHIMDGVRHGDATDSMVLAMHYLF